MIRDGGRQAGFTLLEVLVALALTGLLAAALVGMVRLGVQSWERAAAARARAEALVRLDLTLRRQLASTVPAGALGTIEGRPPLFFGARDGFGWVARTPSAAGGAGLFGQRVRVIAGRGLVLESWRLDRPRRVETAPLSPEPAVRFAYFGSLPRDRPRWHEAWAAGPIPPKLVRVRLPRGSGIADLVYPL